MGLADEVLGHEQTASREPRAGARTPFDGVNDLDPVAVADALGIERDGRKVKCCPGCGASSGCDIMDRGIVCQHDTCARLGNGKVVNGSTFYSNVDSIMVARGCTVREAIGWASERFGTAQWINREPTTHAPEPLPTSTTPYDGGPWLSTDRIFAPLPPPAFVVPELQIGPGRASCFAAYAGAGKTLAMQALALCVASDRPIWGWFRHRGPMRVRHADQDQGAGTLRRYQRLARGMGIDPGELAGRLEVSSFPALYLVDTPDDVWLRASEGIGLMILDALRGFTPGVEENDSQIQHLLMRLAKFSEATGCAYLIAHHFGKPQQGAKPELERLRGSSGIGAALGSVFVLTGERGEPKLRLEGHCARAALERGVERPWVSVSHDAGVAVAVVVLEASTGP